MGRSSGGQAHLYTVGEVVGCGHFGRSGRAGDYPSVRYLDPQLGTGHPCTRTSSVLYFLIRYLDPKVQ